MNADEPVPFEIPMRALSADPFLYKLMPQCDSSECRRRLSGAIVKIGDRMYHAGCVPKAAP